MDQDEFDKFLHHYYQTRPSDRAIEALDFLISSNLITDEYFNFLSYSFSRIGELNPDLIRDYEKLFSRSKVGRPFILSILQNIGDLHTKEFIQQCLEEDEFEEEHSVLRESLKNWAPKPLNVFELPINNPGDLDILWMEFCITGNTKAVVSIIDVLGWSDRVREKLRGWLCSTPRKKSFFDRNPRRLANKLTKAGIIFDNSLENILSTQDLDCFVGMDGCNINHEKFGRFEALLPFGLSQSELNHIWIKSAAKWSLGSNAHQHPLVLETIDSEATKRKDNCRLTLLEISAMTYLALDDIGAAGNKQCDSLSPRPLERLNQQEQADVSYAMLISLPQCEEVEQISSGININEIVSKMVDTNKNLSSYRSRAILEEINDNTSPKEIILYQLEYAKPDKFRVSQIAGKDYDEWVTLGNEHFRGPLYIRSPRSDTLKENDISLNHSLLVDNYINAIKEITADSVCVFRTGNRHYVVLNYQHSAASNFKCGLFALSSEDNESDVPSMQASIWIDNGSHYIVKAEIHFREVNPEGTEPNRVRFMQLFTSHNENMLIVPPAFQLMEST